MENLGFYKIDLELVRNMFSELMDANEFEDVAKGRIGNHLVDECEEGIPIVRTTTKYSIPAHTFTSIHYSLIDHIVSAAQNFGLESLASNLFNNALVEVYDARYTKMKYHSDQALDLEDGSYIGLFTCYEHPDELSPQNLRKLKIKDRVTGQEYEISLDHNSIILFSLAQNRMYHHKIVLEQVKGQKPAEKDNRWMGLTFRKSKTFIRFKDDLPYFLDGNMLKLADESQHRSFYKLRGEENKNIGFFYPDINYTLSVGDTLIPKT